MKTMIIGIVGICVIAGGVAYLSQRPSHPDAAREEAKSLPVAAAESETRSAADTVKTTSSPQRAPAETPVPTPSEGKTVPVAVGATAPSLPFQQALGTLLSAQSTFAQKQEAWQRVKDSGHLDQVISELERRAVSEPTVAETPATLGQAYLQKAGTLNDVREQGILGLKADQSFEAALNLDPSNWEAGFWKAAAMSYWPAQLGKGPEVIQRFVELMKLQEAQQAQPQFVQTYVMLGEQYQRQGYPDYARQIWQRGAALFPNDAKLTEKLSQTQSQPQQAAAR